MSDRQIGSDNGGGSGVKGWNKNTPTNRVGTANQTQPAQVSPESDGNSFMFRLSSLQDRVNRITGNLQDRLRPISRDEDMVQPELEKSHQPQTAYFSECTGFLGCIETDVDRLQSILDRLEL